MPDPRARIDTKMLGLAIKFDSPHSKQNKTSKWRIQFDTGVVIYIPEFLFGICDFHLQEKDPK